MTALQVDIDNGYDAYAIDNSRNTESDQPGVDSQHSTGVSIRVHYLPSDNLGFIAIGTYAKSVIKYSYDGDWGNPVLWAPDASVYQYSEIQNRDRTTKTLELRLGTEPSQGSGWFEGFYGNRLDESLIDLSLGNYQPLGLPADLRWSVGLRGERWSADYQGTSTDFPGTDTGYTNAAVTPPILMA